MDAKVDDFLENVTQWQAELRKLREIALQCQLTETFKWGKPCYQFQQNNIALLIGFKNYVTLAFFKGSLIQDAGNLLVKPGENTQGGRQMRFRSLEEITAQEASIKAYLFEAIEIEKAGLKVESNVYDAPEIPIELTAKFAENEALKSAFETLTPGRKKMYYMYFSEAKQAKTREARIEKSMNRILKGKGLNDCICGHSKRMPSCDGSHKYFK